MFLALSTLLVLLGVSNAAPVQVCVDEDGTKYERTDDCAWIANNCTRFMVCFNGKAYSEEHKCPQNALCATSNGYMGCVCKTGYEFGADRTYCRKIGFEIPADGSCIDWNGDEKSYPEDTLILEDDCKTRKFCYQGRLLTEPHGCGEHSECRQERNGEQKCVCNAGFKYDHHTGRCMSPNKVNRKCVIPGSMVLEHMTYELSDGCTVLNFCLDGELTIQKHACPLHAKCVKDAGGFESCECPKGYDDIVSDECVEGF